MTRRIALAAAGLALTGAAPHLPRVVSLNPCLDAILVRVADRAQIAALSHYSRDPDGSSILAIARTLPSTWGTAEEVAVLRPDVVLGSVHADRQVQAALERMGVRSQRFDVPDTLAGSLEQVRQVAAAAGHPDRGEALVRQIDAAIAAAAPRPGERPVSALLFQPNGLAAGKGTLMDEVMGRAGLVNAAARYGVSRWGNVSLERLLADPPQLLLAGQPAPNAPTWADRVSSHPALRSLAGRMTRVTFPERLAYCGGPVLIETVAALAAARRAAEMRA
ncbi:ABC transporter substrate-binding protein [Caulobacter sp. KR2-114]|uniref:ABC transporter substrate-binding protein n=1 Tax=Caulobacter sp. KR2-114 TaxID=3400912 RepID=UPI003C111774